MKKKSTSKMHAALSRQPLISETVFFYYPKLLLMDISGQTAYNHVSMNGIPRTRLINFWCEGINEHCMHTVSTDNTAKQETKEQSCTTAKLVNSFPTALYIQLILHL